MHNAAKVTAEGILKRIDFLLDQKRFVRNLYPIVDQWSGYPLQLRHKSLLIILTVVFIAIRRSLGAVVILLS
jgi:hypothetical protein